ncbi:MAG: hypothetical protein M5U16_03220 [Hyphomicrobium sp.]|nr:hypothetical protein [Hyphomicrobium sp.]
MFIPLRDENHLKSIPFQYVTVGLIAANVIVFILEVSGLSNAAVASFAVTPRELFGNTVLLAPQLVRRGQPADRRTGDAAHLHVLPCRRLSPGR